MSARRSFQADSASLLVVLFVFAFACQATSWKTQPVSIPTRWAAQVTPANAWPEYPRPQLIRAQWQNLNGVWDYAITASTAPAPRRYDGRILVPYPLESAMSGVKRRLLPEERLWYRRTFEVKSEGSGSRTLLHFGAVDYEATVYLNGKALGARVAETDKKTPQAWHSLAQSDPVCRAV